MADASPMQPGPAAPTVETEETPGRKSRGIGRPFRSKGQVDPDALALARGRQVEKPGWASAFRKAREGRAKKRV